MIQNLLKNFYNMATPAIIWLKVNPKDFPEEYKEKLLEVINEELPWSCCGGCI